MERTSLSFTPLLFLIVLTSACGISVGQVQRFSAAGSEYGHAMDDLLAVAMVTHIDADSERLLNQGFPSEGHMSPADRREIYAKHEGVGDLVVTLEGLRQHAALLQQYFDALNALATTDAPARAETAVEGAANSLRSLGEELRHRPIVNADATLGQLAGLTVTALQRHAIARELRARADLIDQQLRIHKKVAEAVADKLRADRTDISAELLRREVKKPYVDGRLRDFERWVAKRRAAVLFESGTDAMTRASAAAQKLDETWRAIVEHRFDELAFHDLLQDVSSLVSLAETARAIH